MSETTGNQLKRMTPLGFDLLREANIRRLPTHKNKHGIPSHLPDGSDWSPAQWLQAAVGELGEYANFRKKFERGDLSEEQFKKEAAKELADVITYLDILAFRLGIDLGEAIVCKFNEISERVNSPIFLVEGTDYGQHFEYEVVDIRLKNTF